MKKIVLKKTFGGYMYSIMAGNGKPLLHSDAVYTRRRDAVRAIDNLLDLLTVKPVVVDTNGQSVW